MRVAIIGASGQLGTDLVQALRVHDVTPLRHQDLDVCNYKGTRETLSQLRPEIILNTAAYHRVDECEDQVERSFEANAFAVRNLAELCRAIGATLVHLSTDYVFGGDKREPYAETDRPAPTNVYGASKLAGEHLLQATWPRHFIIRSSGLYGTAGASGKGGNFVETMLRLAREGKPIRVVEDQVLTPTCTKVLARKIAELLDTDAYGLYHVTNDGQCSWYEFARKIFEFACLSPALSPTTTEAFGARARRPGFSVLRNAGLEALRLDDLPPWEVSLRAYLERKGHLGSRADRPSS